MVNGEEMKGNRPLSLVYSVYFCHAKSNLIGIMQLLLWSDPLLPFETHGIDEDPVLIVRRVAAELETDTVDGGGAKLDNDFQPFRPIVEIRSTDKLLCHRPGGSAIGRILQKEPFTYFHALRTVEEIDAKFRVGGHIVVARVRLRGTRIVTDTQAGEAIVEVKVIDGGVAPTIVENSKAVFEVFLKDKRPLAIVVDRRQRRRN
jgi:hypothetical protein